MGQRATTRPVVVKHLCTVGPASATQIAKATGVTQNKISSVLRKLRIAGRAHIHGYALQSDRRVTVFAHGPGEDAARPPPKTQAERDSARKIKVSSSAFHVAKTDWPQLRMMAAVMQGPRTRAQLAEATGCWPSRANQIIHAAHKTLGLIYITDWVKEPGKRREPRFMAQTTPFELPDAKAK